METPKREAAGSGVIISADGYIVTNNHVVENAQDITVTLNDKREFPATIVGTDPQTDLALIKIECDGLPTLTFGNSDEVRIGEWVLAVGNPFNLTSTVTAGIVSAKARNLDILGENTSIESFIQTDAAVNQGNSGGALVNASGELIGINSAIASHTGYYTGYSFAIPSNIARKVVGDLKEYGMVQRAVLAVTIQEVDNNVAQELNLPQVKGVCITSVADDGAAYRAGLQQYDVITSINGAEVNSVSELREVMAQYSPGDRVEVAYLRNGSSHKTPLTLLNSEGTTQLTTPTVAGFTEIGETMEGTVEREVMEEVGLKVKNIRYYKSQPWGIASDILMGYFCDVDGDTTIHMDNEELKLAKWFSPEEIELQPTPYSLTNEMMGLFKDKGYEGTL